MRIWTLLIALGFALAVLGLSATCNPMAESDRPRVERFVRAWYKVPENQTITLVDSNSIDPACYRKLIFRASMAAPLLTLYLTPDQKHLVTGVMDLTIEPAVAQREKQKELQDLLESEALLTSPSPNAVAVRLVVFSDFQCPYCKQFTEIVNELRPEERARIQITIRQLPLNIHAWAQDAAAIATCVALRDKAAFWLLSDFFFTRQNELSKETIISRSSEFLSQSTSVDLSEVRACLDEKRFQGSLQRDMQLAGDLGIIATPTVFLNGRRINVRSVDNLRAAIRDAQ